MKIPDFYIVIIRFVGYCYSLTFNMQTTGAPSRLRSNLPLTKETNKLQIFHVSIYYYVRLNMWCSYRSHPLLSRFSWQYNIVYLTHCCHRLYYSIILSCLVDHTSFEIGIFERIKEFVGKQVIFKCYK